MILPPQYTDSLTRPRIAVAILSAAAAASLGYYIYQIRTAHAVRFADGGLHRSNAVRRPRRRSRQHGQDSTVSSSSSSESHGDENAEVAAIRPLNDDETVIECTDEWWTDPSSIAASQRAGHNIVSLLFRVSEDNARRNACVHRGCACNACNMHPIRGIRYRCANCHDFDLCETCESQGSHNKTHIFYKIKVPAPPFGPRQMQPVWYTGDPDTCLRNLPRSLLAKLGKETGFERPELEALWEQWTYMANREWREDPDDLCLAMDRKTFERCLVPSSGSRYAAPNLIHDRMFSFYDTNNDDLIGFSEFLYGLAYRKRQDKLRKIFDGYDMDSDGFVNRRDFLRMFRAYYVLYNQMHRDILDGMDDQLMGSAEAQQLVTGRQPLSSLFGRDSRIPRADLRRRFENKVYHSNGDIELRETASAVREHKGDIADREEILTRLFAVGENETSLRHYNSSDSDNDATYWDALLNAPTSVEELPNLLNGLSRSELDITELDDEGSTSGNEDEDTENLVDTQRRASVPNDDADALVEPSRFVNAIPTESALRAQVIAHSQETATQAEKKRRATARAQLHERWKRRQFYLDEEEGRLPPGDWEQDEDTLINLNGQGESSKSAQHHVMSPRSRSSSKVRFAEDTDDFEIRSNPSTSSRSVPERWGGMDIPDVERDAGKEILYQITQQAFNELLDTIFKPKEDLAVQAGETRDQRNTFRHLFNEIDLSEDTKENDGTPQVSNDEAGLFVDENKPIPDRSLPELLATSGYTLREDANGGDELDQLESSESPIDGPSTPMDDGVILVEIQALDGSSEESTVKEAVLEDYRDPTMPQFRPNSVASTSTSSEAIFTPQTSDGTRSLESPKQRSPHSKGVEKSWAGPDSDLKAQDAAPPTRSVLLLWKRLDDAEQEAISRGGWGKLSFEEFKEIYESQRSQGNRLDYLGSWIDFCIP
jgi:Ca2+-binding EF-hand superfamily protein